MSNKFYPKLSSITKIEQLPEQLNFIQGGINTCAGVQKHLQHFGTKEN